MSTAQAVEKDANKAVVAHSGQFLTFILAGEEYGVEILKVQEIRGWSAVTRIPNTPSYVQGVLNLRGTIVPIIDLRMRFKLERIDYTPTTVIVVLSVVTDQGRRTIGIVVDGVSDVLSATDGEIKPAPNFGESVRTEFVNGLVAANNKMVILLDSDKLLTASELAALDAIH
jgi:purine-binding chemotaxis protein CheW